jgi:phage baseplate assembly protein W
LLVFAVLYTFGLQHHVGAGALSDFFQLIRLHTHVGVSPSALQTQLSRMEALLPLFQQQCEASVPTRTRQAVVAADETFFGEILILVLMDLSSGYLLLESIQKDRGFDTWFAQVTPRLEALGIEVNHAISDRAKALIKLAVTGFECTSGADTFHEQYGLSRWLSPALGRRKAKADQCCELAQKALDQPSRGASTEEKAALAAQQACAWEARAQVEQAQQEYQKQLLGIAEEIHPFSLEENTRTTAESVVAGLETRAQALETLAAQQGIQDTRSALKKFRAQIGALSSHVSFWWLWVEEILLGWSLDEATRQWLTSKLLPVLYWHYQMRKTQNRVHRKRYQEAWQRALEAWKADPFHSPACSDTSLDSARHQFLVMAGILPVAAVPAVMEAPRSGGNPDLLRGVVAIDDDLAAVGELDFEDAVADHLEVEIGAATFQPGFDPLQRCTSASALNSLSFILCYHPRLSTIDQLTHAATSCAGFAGEHHAGRLRHQGESLTLPAGPGHSLLRCGDRAAIARNGYGDAGCRQREEF